MIGFHWFRWVGLFDREFTIYLTVLGITPWVAISKVWPPCSPEVDVWRGGVAFYSGRVNFGLAWPFLPFRSLEVF